MTGVSGTTNILATILVRLNFQVKNNKKGTTIILAPKLGKT